MKSPAETLAELSISLSPAFLWVAFLVLLIFSITVSTILLYHWGRYGQHVFSIGLVTITYLIGIVVLVGLSALFLASYIASV